MELFSIRIQRTFQLVSTHIRLKSEKMMRIYWDNIKNLLGNN